MGTISVSQLSKSFANKNVISNLSFEIPKGRITGLLGPNGAGKTTTLRLLTGSLHPDKGTIQYDGFDFFENKIEIQKKIGYLSESSPIYWNLTVFEYLSFLGKAKGILKKNLKEKIDFVSSLLQLETVLPNPIGFLSKGFRQRVALAGSLIQDPEYIFLDEPSSGLDPIQIVEFKKLVRILGKTKTIIFSSHILQEIEELCDHVLILYEGKLIFDQSLVFISQNSPCLILAKTDPGTFKSFFSLTDYEIETTGRTENSFLEFRIQSPKSSSEEIFQILKNANFPIRSINPEKNSLESVFKSLMTNKQNETFRI